MKTVILLKSYVKGHTRRLKSGKTVQVQPHYDKRTKRGAEHAPGHGHDLSHMTPEQRSRFDAMHNEHHLLTFYHRHALTARIAEHEKAIAELDEKAKAETNSVKRTKLHNKALAHKTALIRHKKNLAHVDEAISFLASEKETHVQGAGTLDASQADQHHAAYVEKLGSPWVDKKEIVSYPKPEASHPGAANTSHKGEGKTMNADELQALANKPSRIDLDIPYDKKDTVKAAAKAAGTSINWDSSQKTWYWEGVGELPKALNAYKAVSEKIKPASAKLQALTDEYVSEKLSAAAVADAAEKDDAAYAIYDQHNSRALDLLKPLCFAMAKEYSQEELFHMRADVDKRLNELNKSKVKPSDPEKARLIAMQDMYSSPWMGVGIKKAKEEASSK